MVYRRKRCDMVGVYGATPPPVLGIQSWTRTTLSDQVVLNALMTTGHARAFADPRITTNSGHTASYCRGNDGDSGLRFEARHRYCLRDRSGEPALGRQINGYFKSLLPRARRVPCSVEQIEQCAIAYCRQLGDKVGRFCWAPTRNLSINDRRLHQRFRSATDTSSTFHKVSERNCTPTRRDRNSR